MRMHSIRAAVIDGRIPAEFVVERPAGKNRTTRVITDPDAAELALKANTNPAKRGAAKNDGWNPNADIPGGADVPTILQSRAISEAYKAKIARLEYEEAAGNLVNAEEVKKEFASMISIARSHLLAIPSKLKGRLPHLTVDEISILDELVREALESIADGG